MKHCPQCRQTFSEDYLYCLVDGTPLTAFDPREEAAADVRQPPARPPARPPERPAPWGAGPALKYLAVGLLAFLVGGAFILWQRSGGSASPAVTNVNADTASGTAEPASNKEQERLSREKADLQEAQASLEKERQKLAEERKALEAQSTKPTGTPSPAPAAEPTERITFQKGSVQETIYGSVASERSYVLRTRSGQNLSASASSSGGCVVFSNGSTNMSYTTARGDSTLTLVNNCGARTRFSLTIHIQ